MSYEPQKKLTNFDKRISAFVDVETSMEKKDTKNFLSRHSTKLKFVKSSQKKIELLIPINDHGISCSLSKVIYCHPFLPIGLLNDPSRQPIPNDKLNELLLPFQLYTETANEPASQMLIPQLANLFSMKVTEFLIYYKGKQTKTKIIKDNWKSLFSRSSLSQTEIDDQMKVFFDRLVSRFPDEDWVLKSLDDLYSLHVLACSMNMQFYLIFPKIPEKSLSTYSLRIGMTSRHKYEIYIVVQSSNQFSIAQPLNYKKILDPAKDEIEQGHHKRSKKFNFLNTFETIDQNFALYYNYKKNLFHTHNDKKFKNIESQIVEKTNINCPLLAIHTKDSQVLIDAEIPSFDEENTALLTSFLESISDKFNQAQSIEDTDTDDLSSKTFTISCKNAYKVMGSDKFYIVSRETREKEQEKTLEELSLASKPQDLNAPCYEVVKNQMVYVGDQENGDLPDIDALRIVLGSQLSKEEGQIQEEDEDKDLNEVTLFDQSGVSFEELVKSRQLPSLTPLFLPQKSRITLAQCARSKYAEDLCTLSILKYCAGHVKCPRKCARCKNIIDQQTLMLPYTKSPLEEILFICHKCNKKHDNTKTLTMNQHDTLLYKLSTKSHDTNISSATFIKEIDSYIKIYEENINFLREHPIGHLRQMHNLIDAAFSTLQKIIASHKILSSSGPAIPLHSMLGIRDIKEAEIQLKDLASSFTEEPVNSDLFVEYLSKQTDIQYSSQQYQLVKKPEDIVKDLDQIIMSIFNDMTFKVIDECPVKEVNGKPQKILPLYNVRAFPDPINHIMNVKFNFPGKENQKRIVNKYQYKTYVLRNANHLSLSPESTIATSKDIIYLWKYNKKTILVLAQGEVLEECKDDKANEIYKDVYLYLVPLGNVNLEFCTPLMIFKESIVKCADFNQTSSSHQLAICINTLMSQKLFLIDVGPRTKLCQTSEVELTNVYNIKYGTDDLYAVALDDDGQMVVHVVSSAGIVKTKYHFPAIHDETTNDVIKTLELVGSPRYMLAVLRDGTVHELSNNEEEEADEGEEKENNEEENEGENAENGGNEEENENEVESVYSNLDGVSIDSPIVKTMLGTDQGLANIVQKFDENNEFTGEFDVHFYPSQEPSPKFSISFGHINDHQPFFNQYGMHKDKAQDKPLDDDDDDEENEGNENALNVNRYIWNIHLTAAEFFPALIAYESHGLMFLVQKNMEQFREVNCNNFFASAIQSFYSRTFSKMSLHHVEDVIREHGLKVNIITFLCDMVESKMTQFIDTIFGTKFSTISINGVWVGIRVIGKTAHVIIYFHGNNSNKLNELRLTAAIRASNLIMINSYRIINTFNFIKQYQDDVPKFHFLTEHYPKIMTMYFQESENYSVTIDSIWQYRSIKNIKTNFCFVPYRPSWNTSGIDDLLEKAENVDDEEEEEDIDEDETITQIFLKQINDLIGFNKKSEKDKKQNKASYRKLLPPEKGINMVCQIITTYLTLYEFQDLPIKTVLPYCKLNSPK